MQLPSRLSIIALTDHNEITNVPGAIAAAAGKKLTVLPGIELTTPEGHLLVYFDEFENLEAFYGKLTFADRGKEKSRCQTGILDCLNQIDPAKGFAILAHIDGAGGFETVVKGYSPHKFDVIAHPALLAIELQSVQAAISYSHSDPEAQRAECGRQRYLRLGLGEKQYLARVLFSTPTP